MTDDNKRIGFKLDSSACRSIDAYLEYSRIVGDDDGGKLFSPDEYEAYKQNVIPSRFHNRLYVNWVNGKTGLECKAIGPETNCFCRHRYKQHKSDFKKIPSDRPIELPCKVSGCACKSYLYIPSNGSQSIRCTTCKHVCDDHSVAEPYRCKKDKCACEGFRSAFTCGCGYATYDHCMSVETRSGRETLGKPTGHPVPYKAMGGLTGFSSLADGYMRLEMGTNSNSKELVRDSPPGPGYMRLEMGTNSNSKELVRDSPPVPFDPFAKVQAELAKLCMADDHALTEELSQEERDMAYFEKRYQQRLKAERESSRAKHSKK